MAIEAVRVALLARPGPARDRLRSVIEEAGASCVLDGDPGVVEPATLVQAAPQLVLIALDPQSEEALERFDEVLFDPAVDVVYEEAELAAGREGWEVARWQRHLVAKLQRHGDVLPPGREPEDEPGNEPQPEPQPLATAADAGSRDGPALGPGADDVASATFGELPPEPAADPLPSIGPDSKPPMDGPDGLSAPDAGASVFDPVLAEFEAGAAEWTLDAGPALEAETAGAGAFGDGSLEDPADEAPRGPDEAEVKGRFERDLDMLESRIAGLQLVDDAPPGADPTGAVVVLAGIGGPDAVRQLLGALPPTLPRPVLVRQQLDGARYDKLVAQMQRVSPLPVVLAEDGVPLQAGVVHVVPPDLGLAVDSEGSRFKAGAELLGVLPPADSAIVLLSGSDPGLVDGLMKQRLAGALVAGQVAEGCYDPAASEALKMRGGDTATPLQLAADIAARWPGGGEST